MVKCPFIAIICVILLPFGAYSASIKDLGDVKVYSAYESGIAKEKVDWISGSSISEIMTRIWKTENGDIHIKSDLDGDGYLDEIFVRVVCLNGISLPVIVTHNSQLLLLWPFQKFDEFKLGDVDKDGDADIILPDNYAVMMDYEQSDHVRPELSEAIEAANNRINGGDILGAFKEAFSLFAGTPYKMGAAGEGDIGRFDRDPEVVTDVSDCVIMIEQLLAILRSGGDTDGFLSALLKIRYLDGDVRYEKRNHFNEVDWIPNNIAAGFIKDIMPVVLPDAPVVTGTISKKNWYAVKDKLEGDFSDLTEEEINKRIAELQGLGKSVPDEKGIVAYYPFEKMYVVENGKYSLNGDFVQSLPPVSIFNMINKDKSFKDKNGNWITDIIVSHTGFLVKDGNSVVVYHATSATDSALATTTQEELISFLSRRFIGKDSTSLVGFHLSKPILK